MMSFKWLYSLKKLAVKSTWSHEIHCGQSLWIKNNKKVEKTLNRAFYYIYDITKYCNYKLIIGL